MKHKRVWTDEQRQAAGERMRLAQKKRWENQARGVEKENGLTEGYIPTPVMLAEPPHREVAPEVQAVLATMTPERKAKLAAIQSRTISTMGGAEALERHEAEKVFGTSEAPHGVVEEQGRVGVRDMMMRLSSDGTMVSTLGPCWCGAAKREWHKIH